MQKKIQVQVNHKYGSAGLLPGLPYTAVWDCNVLATLLWVGILTSPPRYTGIDLSTFWAWLRYASAISERYSGLRLKPVWSEIDKHQMSVMSDDFGMGFACHYLAEQHGIQAFANTSYLLDSLVGVASLRPSKSGSAKSPDFIGIDAKGQLHVLECKGTQTSTAYLVKALVAGIDQKNNLSNGTIFASSMVGGIYVPQHASKEDALLMYIDPKPDSRLKKLEALSPDVIEAGIYRISFAKELMAAGLWQTASAIDEGKPPSDYRGPNGSMIGDELPRAGFSELDQMWQRAIQYRSIEVDPIEPIFNEEEEYQRLTSLTLDVPSDTVAFTREVLDMDRGGARSQADKLIVERAKGRREKRLVRVRSQGSETASMRTRTHTVQSPWREQTFGPTSASLTGPSGIQFTLSRQKGD
ncbi:hypothetical protein [Burkholderia contaminans]|uniref:hypothetical protein n=1 Tax=Burkholderia contaminans TaxID=488447 RepID=UPI00115FA1DC|nr:hypothetical protein [Burkholderia contaminans]